MSKLPDQSTHNPNFGAKEKAIAYVGIGYALGTVISVALAQGVKKLTPNLYEKMVRHYEKKYADQPITADNSPREQAERAVDARLMAVGGFLTLPLASAYEVSKKEGSKFHILGPDAGKNLPKWVTGRTVALCATLTSQGLVDRHAKGQKDAFDNAVARMLMKVTGKMPKEALAEELAQNPTYQKILHNVRLASTDTYLTLIAIPTQIGMAKGWEAAAQVLSGSTSASSPGQGR